MSDDGGGNCAFLLDLAVKERKWSLKKNERTRGRCREKRRRKRVRVRLRLRRCGNGNVNENVSCLIVTREQEGLHRV